MARPLIEIFYQYRHSYAETVGYVDEEIYDEIYPILEKHAKKNGFELQERVVEEIELRDIETLANERLKESENETNS